jgi:hypothetical protein
MNRYTVSRETYNRHTATNVETGAVVTQWDRVTVGKSSNVWDVAEILSEGEVRLHRQTLGRVTYRRASLDSLTVVERVSE